MTSAPDIPAVYCRSLCLSFDGTCALADLDLSLSGKGVTAIIGPNGAGKTTLLNVITGFMRPDSGECLLNGRSVRTLPPHRIVRQGVSRTFQDLRLIRQVPVIENVMLGRPGQKGESLPGALFRFGVAKQEAENRDRSMELLRFVGLEEKAWDLAGDLSYGQQKLLTLACCLATDASLLLLDEPVAGVHPDVAERILELMGRLASEGKGIVFIEHDLAAVRKAADHVVVMDEGRVFAEGAPDEVLNRPEILEAYVG